MNWEQCNKIGGSLLHNAAYKIMKAFFEVMKLVEWLMKYEVLYW